MTTPPRPRAKTRWRRRLLSSGLGAVMALLLGEVAVRVGRAAMTHARVTKSQLRESADTKLAPGAEATLGRMIRAAQHPDVIFELVPNLDVRFEGARVVTNEDGFRGPLRARKKPDRGYRIVGLGDSVLFGWAVPFEQSGLAVLEGMLQQALPDRVVEAVDTAVPGYNTAMEAQVLVEKGLAYAPDLVLVDCVGNDFDLPNYLWEPTNYWRLDRSFLYDSLWRTFGWRYSDLDGPFVWAPVDPDGSFASDLDKVPAEYRHLVGPAAYRRALERIQALGKEHGFRVLVTCHHDLMPEAREACIALGVPFTNLRPRITEWLRANGHREYLGSPLTVSAHDPHPSALLHRWWAEAVFARLQELGWLPEAR